MKTDEKQTYSQVSHNMVKLYQLLESTFKMRINSNSEIIPYIKRLSEMGKFDEPKKIAAIAILLDRLGKLEDETETEKSLQDIAKEPLLTLNTSDSELQEEAVNRAKEQIAYEESLKPTDTAPINEPEEITVESEKTVSSFTPEQLTDTPTEEAQKDTSTTS